MGCCKSKAKPKYIPDNSSQNAPVVQSANVQLQQAETQMGAPVGGMVTRTVTTVTKTTSGDGGKKSTTTTKVTKTTMPTGFRVVTQCSESDIKPFLDSLHARFPKGYLTKEDMRQVFVEKFPRGNPDAFIDNMFTIMDTNRDGKVQVREFATVIAMSSYSTLDSKINGAFKFMDKDGNGSISKQEVASFFETLAKLRTGFNLKYRAGGGAGNAFNFNIADKDGDNQISKQEFVDYVRTHPAVLDILRDLDLL